MMRTQNFGQRPVSAKEYAARAPAKPEPPPNRIVREPTPWGLIAALALAFSMAAGGLVYGLMRMLLALNAGN